MTDNFQSLRTVTEFGEIASPLRNIRMALDGRSALFHLVPEAISHEPLDLSKIDDPDIRSVLADTEEIVEAATCLQLEFNVIYAIAVDGDLGFDAFSGLQTNWQEAPKIRQSKAYYPFLEVVNSKWASQLPDWQIHPGNVVKHFRMISAECCFDVLAADPTGTWVDNIEPSQE